VSSTASAGMMTKCATTPIATSCGPLHEFAEIIDEIVNPMPNMIIPSKVTM
jgi:hypothetical protein